MILKGHDILCQTAVLFIWACLHFSSHDQVMIIRIRKPFHLYFLNILWNDGQQIKIRLNCGDEEPQIIPINMKFDAYLKENEVSCEYYIG